MPCPRRCAAWRSRAVSGREERRARTRCARRSAPPSAPTPSSCTIARVLDAFERDGAAAAALPLADTIRRADADSWAAEPLDRDGVWVMQTPQAFRYADLVKGYAIRADATDCAAAAQAAGVRVRLVAGHPANFKVTSPEDLAFARSLVARGAVTR